jgi:type I restriction enzyme S subunit
MIEGLKPHAEYKESGQEWLGKIPAHWDVRRTKLILREVDSRSTTGKEQLLRVSQYTGVTQRKAADGSDAPDTRAASLVGYKRVSVNDLVINIMLAWNGSMGVSRFDGIASPAYCVYRLNKGAQPWYFHQLFRLPLYKGRIKAVSTGVIESRLRLYSDDLGRIEAILPPPDEQAAIVRFLDHANRKIDGFIRAKRKLIGLLNEQKQAIIQTAISKVSTPDCKTMPVRAVLRPVKRMGYPTKTLLSLFRDYGVIPKDSRENKNVDVRDLALCQLVKPGDVVMNKMKAWQGSIAVSSLEGIVSPDYMVLEFQIKAIVEDFFHYALRSPSMVANYRKQAYGVRPGQWRLMYPDFCRLRLPVPSVEVQQSIVDQIKSETAALTTAIARTEREIALMQEYRTRLTADLVTGKLDVREAAAKLPEVEPEPAAEEALEEPETEEDNE